MSKNSSKSNKKSPIRETVFLPVDVLSKRLQEPRFPDMLYTDKAVHDAQRLAYVQGLKDFKKSIDWEAMKKMLRHKFRHSTYKSELVKIAMEETYNFIYDKFRELN